MTSSTVSSLTSRHSVECAPAPARRKDRREILPTGSRFVRSRRARRAKDAPGRGSGFTTRHLAKARPLRRSHMAQRRRLYEVFDWSDPRRECCRVARRKETLDEPGLPISVLRSRGPEHARRHRTGPDLEEREWAERTDRRASLHAPAASASYPRASASSDPVVVTSASWHLEFECVSAAESSRSRVRSGRSRTQVFARLAPRQPRR
jgi:hypothetical protein